MEEELKIKPLTKEQIIISLDRLTRFKFTEDKYLRVFKDIIVSNLIYPKYKKSRLDLMDYAQLTSIAQEIFNFSLSFHNLTLTGDYNINSRLREYENSVFDLSKDMQVLLNNKIDYKAALEVLYGEDLPKNLNWLKTLTENVNQVQIRKKSGLKFPLEKIIITEGITEEILLPKFAKLCGCDFDKLGIYLISAGGKNQVVKIYYQLVKVLKLPIFVLLDSDAKENLTEISPRLRKIDKVHILEKGEFEDILPLDLIKKTLNNHFKNFSSVKLEDLRKDLPMTKILEEIFKEKGLSEFKKAEFAALVAENLTSKEDVSSEIIGIVEEINNI